MSTLYPSLPSEPTYINDGGWEWPEWVKDKGSGCPVCGAEWRTSRPLTLQPHSIDKEKYHDIPSYPHFSFACGGIWRDLGEGFWGGKCWAKKKQLELTLTEDTA